MNETEAIIAFLKSLVSAGDLTGEGLAYKGEPLVPDEGPDIEISAWGGRTIPEIEAMRPEYERLIGRLDPSSTTYGLFEGRGEHKLPKFFIWNHLGSNKTNYINDFSDVDQDHKTDVIQSTSNIRFLSMIGKGNMAVEGKGTYVGTLFNKVTGDGSIVEPYHKIFGKIVERKHIVERYKNILQSLRDIVGGASQGPDL